MLRRLRIIGSSSSLSMKIGYLSVLLFKEIVNIDGELDAINLVDLLDDSSFNVFKFPSYASLKAYLDFFQRLIILAYLLDPLNQKI